MEVPEAGTVERWAWDYVAADDWATKLAPPPLPERWEEGAPARRIVSPGRGPRFSLARHGDRSTGKSELRSAERRIRLIHSFLHHELQAAELMAWAVLAFPDAPRDMRQGLLRVLADEVRHMGLYRDYLAKRSVAPGDLPVRDWFWERVPSCPDAASFLATMGIGFEGGNLDHAARFAARFRAAGDEEGAALEDRIGREEIAHVRFALRWFRALTAGGAGKLGELRKVGELGELGETDGPADAGDFARWRAALPPPLSPLLMQGKVLAREARGRAGMGASFLDALTRAASEPL